MIRNELVSWLQEKSGGGITKSDNYKPLVPIGQIIIQGLIGLPMDNVGNLRLSDDYRDMAKSMQPFVNKIARNILDCKRKIMSQKNQVDNINEMVNLYSNMFIFEELFNKTINLLTENV